MYTHCLFAVIQIYCDREDICFKLIREIISEKNPRLLSTCKIVPEKLPERTCAEPFKITEANTTFTHPEYFGLPLLDAGPQSYLFVL